jgi:hypothetical protein
MNPGDLEHHIERLDEVAAEAWEAGMRHALAWLGLRNYGDVMAKDNPHKAVGG